MIDGKLPKFQDVWPQIDEFPKLPDDIPAPKQPLDTVTVLYGCWPVDEQIKKFNEQPYYYKLNTNNGNEILIQSDGKISINEEDNKYGPRH